MTTTYYLIPKDVLGVAMTRLAVEQAIERGEGDGCVLVEGRVLPFNVERVVKVVLGDDAAPKPARKPRGPKAQPTFALLDAVIMALESLGTARFGEIGEFVADEVRQGVTGNELEAALKAHIAAGKVEKASARTYRIAVPAKVDGTGAGVTP